MDTEDTAKVINDDNGLIMFQQITKEDLSVKGTIRAVGSRAYAQKAEQVQELMQLTNMLAADPSLAVHFPAKERAKRIESLLGTNGLGLYREWGGLAEQFEGQIKQKELADATASQLGEVPPPEVA